MGGRLGSGAAPASSASALRPESPPAQGGPVCTFISPPKWGAAGEVPLCTPCPPKRKKAGQRGPGWGGFGGSLAKHVPLSPSTDTTAGETPRVAPAPSLPLHSRWTAGEGTPRLLTRGPPPQHPPEAPRASVLWGACPHKTPHLGSGHKPCPQALWPGQPPHHPQNQAPLPGRPQQLGNPPNPPRP